jgi:hypothetical protein
MLKLKHKHFHEFALRSLNLPIAEVIHIINLGFEPHINKYNASQWETQPEEEEHAMDKYARYLRMVGQEEFQRIATSIVALRLINKVCSWCEKTHDQLKLCSNCKLTYYCSVDCQRQDKRQHKKWCSRRFDGIRDTGPACVVLIERS